MQKKKIKISVISQIHYCKLILRSLLLIAALALALSISAFAYSEESPQENAG